MRPRTAKRKCSNDGREEDERGADGSQGARLRGAPSTLGKVSIMVPGANTSQALDLQRLLAQPGAAARHDKMPGGQQQTSRNSSSNTSHSQTSSYTNDDSHSGDQGSDSGGSGWGSGNNGSPPQAPRSPGQGRVSTR
jgi:hypothetical protein